MEGINLTALNSEGYIFRNTIIFIWFSYFLVFLVSNNLDRWILKDFSLKRLGVRGEDGRNAPNPPTTRAFL